MNFEAAERIARALLYEGYLLYPYRASAVKNQRRWTFGCLLPSDYSQPPNSAEGSFSRTECLLVGDNSTTIEVRARFLQIENATQSQTVEREVIAGPWRLTDLTDNEIHREFAFPPINGTIDVAAHRFDDNHFKLRAELRNLTHACHLTREGSLPCSLLSSHVILRINSGHFLSMQDPPELAREAASRCQSVRAWPILIGDAKRCDMLLSSPIILSDFPQVAAESPGDLFDATEMDEMLTLRIRTLTSEEKHEMAETDPRAADLLRRSEAMADFQLGELHGAWRNDEATKANGITAGTRVRLCPKGNADIYDLALAGKTAVVVSIERDFEDRVYACVALDDDPGQDYGIAGRPGHRFFYGIDEVEPLPPVRILIAGIGNIFLGDDAFGVEVVRRLMERRLPESVVVRDFGIRGFDLACALQDGYDAAILVDALASGDSPGTLHVLEPDARTYAPTTMEMHHLHPIRVIEMARQMGGRLPCLRVVGCDPETLEPNETASLSQSVQSAVEPALDLIENLVANLLRGQQESAQ